jgi:glutamate synthase (NADPH/NADH) large chain
VKLVSKAGVGTIAAGVAKAKADVVLISGHDGGTGASPISSIKHAGLPWELGLAETHQTLVKNTGRDIAIATLLGAEEWGIATAALIVEGCIMMRKCHLNTCPVGIATQDGELRKRFTGDPDHVVNFFRFITAELREVMAELGFRTINEMVGQVDSLEARSDVKHWKHSKLNLSPVLYKEPNSLYTGLFHQEQQDHALDNLLDWKLLKAAEPSLARGEKITASFPIVNTDRTVGTILSNEISTVLPACLMTPFISGLPVRPDKALAPSIPGA